MPNHSSDHLPSGLFIADAGGRVIYVNERWCEIAGIPAEQAMGDGWRRAVHPDDLDALAGEWQDAVAWRRPFRCEARFLHADGRVVWFEGEGFPINSSETGNAGYIGTCTDRTGGRRDLARSRLYEALLSNNPDFAYVFDTSRRFIYANQSLLTMWGKTWEQSIGLDLREIGYPEWHAAMHEREIDSVVATGRPVTGEVHFDGTHGRRLYEYIFSPIIGNDGRVEAVAGATRDVTERKQAEERANFLNELSGRVMRLDTEAEIIAEAVGSLGRQLGVGRCYFIESLKGENLLRVAPDWFREGEASIAGDYPIDSFGGEDWWEKYSASALAVEDVTSDPLTSTNFDSYLRLNIRSYATRPFRRVGPWSVVLAVTESAPRRWSEEEITLLDHVASRVWPLVEQLRWIDSLREADRRKDQFLATLAHELRNPLAPVLTGLELMRRAKDEPGTVDRMTGILERQISQMAHLINDLLDISRVNTGKIILDPQPSSLAVVLRNAIETAQPALDERGHHFTADLPPESLVVLADGPRISQAVSNLLSNAAKYTPGGGTIRLDHAVAGDGIRIRVTDNGQGVEPAEQAAIFEPFHQSANGSADGLGIGLTLVRALMEMHGGTVTVRSEGRGKGSEFILHLPASVAAESFVPEHEETPPTPPAAKRVLVVDDGRANADMLAIFLRHEGMEVAVAYDGLEALEASRSFRPEFVVMDIGMPVMDGIESAKQMRAEGLDAVLIALSGWGREEDRQSTAEAGFHHHLTKPVSPADLRRLIAG
ncbi:PAS domain S-box protein [Luteolibacter yonseiensis]|uniref:histidine kinase n=1 Tax=Luteolibacter yonseiensis TaxID=1144680 RepID=A0A934R4L5_9BACT|nr:PAS domain-containing protein [Luteolibacter yonseiensis]MBK1815170.1 PAS domain S-box protein [Luteolibacter yonseiensis]